MLQPAGKLEETTKHVGPCRLALRVILLLDADDDLKMRRECFGKRSQDRNIRTTRQTEPAVMNLRLPALVGDQAAHDYGSSATAM